MNQLELLWKLENSKTLLDEINREYHVLNQDEKIDFLAKKVNKLKKNISELNNNLLTDSILLKENHNKLKEHTYTINNMREELYSGLITDLRQLDYLNKEKDKLKDLINSIETDILNSMERTEKMELDSLQKEEEIISLTFEIEELKLGKSLLLKELEVKIKKYEIEYKDIESKIEENLIHRFQTLRTTRANSIVAVKNNVCSGCNMRVPTFLNDALKAKEQVIYCESCGRMLYYIDIETE